jgi:hypothetical protein
MEPCGVWRATVADSHNFDRILIRIKVTSGILIRGSRWCRSTTQHKERTIFFSQHFRNVVLDPDPHFGFMRIRIQHLDYNPKMIYRLWQGLMDFARVPLGWWLRVKNDNCIFCHLLWVPSQLAAWWPVSTGSVSLGPEEIDGVFVCFDRTQRNTSAFVSSFIWK